MALDVACAYTHVEFVDHTIDIILLERLFNSVEKHAHELLHVLLLEAL